MTDVPVPEHAGRLRLPASPYGALGLLPPSRGIEALSGEVVRLATQLGTTAPLNEAIVKRIHTLQR